MDLSKYNPNREFLLYKTDKGDIKVDVLLQNETIWLPQKGIAQLFGCSTDNVSLHFKNIFAEGELEPNSVIEEISATASDGKSYKTKFYNLDAIIAVGYRVNSKQATQFRIWATNVLKEFIIKGYTMDVERLKIHNPFLVKTILKNSLKKSETSEVRNAGFIRKLPIFMPSAVLIMITIQKPQKSFSPLYKTNYIGQLRSKLLPK